MAINWMLVIFSCIWILSGDVNGLCDTAALDKETAYAGEDKIRFPVTSFGSRETAFCRWQITAYRKGHVVQLDFDDVVLERHLLTGSCVEEIYVYDGPEITSPILSSFCGREEPRLVTSSRDTLVVFSSNKSFLDNGTFTLRYRAVRDRPETSEDTTQVLRTAFGAFIGVVACVVIFSWSFRRYKRARPNRNTLVQGRPRTTTGCSNGLRNVCASSRNGDTRAASAGPPQLRQPGRLSFKGKMTVFFRGVILKLSPRRMTVGSVITSSSNSSRHQQQSCHTIQACPANCCHGQPSSLYNTNIRDNSCDLYQPTIPHNLYPVTGLEDFRASHMTMNYPMVPISSFTSDPEAVRPPKYEDCFNSTQPVYLHNTAGNTFYNRAFNLKDEETDCLQIFSPPPPYSEIGQEIPSLGAIADEPTHPAWMVPCQPPPHYEVAPIGAAATSGMDAAEYDPDHGHSCERGETLINVAAMQNTSIAASSARTTNPTARLHPYVTSVSAATVQVGSTIELAGSTEDVRGHASDSGPTRLTSSTVPRAPSDHPHVDFTSLQPAERYVCLDEQGGRQETDS